MACVSVVHAYNYLIECQGDEEKDEGVVDVVVVEVKGSFFYKGSLFFKGELQSICCSPSFS